MNEDTAAPKRTRARHLRWWVIGMLALVAAACGPPTHTDTSVDQVPDANRNTVELIDGASAPVAAIDNVVENFLAAGSATGCAVGITEGDEIAYLQAYGVREYVPDGGTLDFTVATRSAVGSVSKFLTSIGAMALVESGDLQLTDELQDIVNLPAGLPNAYRTATLEELLSHRARVQNGPSWASGNNTTTPNEVTAQPGNEDEKGAVPRKAIMGLDTSSVGVVSTGTYSNLGYLLAGAMIDAVVTEPGFDGFDSGTEAGYEAWIWTVLNDTDNDRKLWSAALNHPWREDGDLEVFASDAPFTSWGYFGWEGPAGGWTMTIGDLARLALTMRDENYLSDESWDDMKSNYGTVTQGSGSFNYGLGLVRDNRLGHPAFSHGGLIRGYRADVFYVPFDEIGVAVMCSASSGDVRGLAEDVGEAWQAGPGGIIGPVVLGDAVSALRADGLSELITRVEQEGRRGRTPAEVERILRAEAAQLPDGEKILEAVDAQDLETFAACYLKSTNRTDNGCVDIGCPDGWVPTPAALNDALGPCMPGTIVPNVHVSCLAGNGRVDMNIANPLDDTGKYRFEFGRLSAREIKVGAGDWGRLSMTGRPDGAHALKIMRNGVVLVDRQVEVACDERPRTSEPEVTIINTCRAGNGYLLMQMVNPTDAAKPYVIEFENVPNRSTTAAPYGAAVRAVTGRPDGEWNVLVRSGSEAVHKGIVKVSCDGRSGRP